MQLCAYLNVQFCRSQGHNHWATSNAHFITQIPSVTDRFNLLSFKYSSKSLLALQQKYRLPKDNSTLHSV